MAAIAARAARVGGLRPLPTERLEIRDDPEKGRGLFARLPIGAGALIETAPVVIIAAAECAHLDRTILHDYYFRWNAAGSGAVALGLLALCNHSRRPRARVRCNYARQTLDLIALAPIAAGAEITIDYDCPLWFAPQD
jgi:uncharacterized protein